MKKAKGLWRTLLFFILLAALCGSFALPTVNMPVNAAPSTSIVISQIYGGGGNSGATYKNDFIELHNVGPSTVSLTGWSVQYAGAGISTWSNANKTDLSGSIAPGQYYLIQEAQGTGGTTDLPIPDVIGTIAMSATSGKIALVNTTTLLSGSGCPFDASVVDFIGYGSGTNCSENTAAPAPSNTNADIRSGNGCTDTDNNNADFTAATPSPRNSSSPVLSCTGVTNVTSSMADGIYTTGASINITVTFSGIVDVTGSPRLLLETGATDEFATYASGSGTNSLSFNYGVVAGDSSSDLDYVATNSLDLNGGTITDAIGTVVLTLPNPGSPGSLAANNNIVIDNGVAPSIISFTRQSPSSATTNADTLTFRVTFSKAVTGVDSNDFVATGTTGTPTSVNAVSNSVYDVTISGGDLPNLNGIVGLNLSPTQNITDLVSKPLPPGEPPVDETYTLDNTSSLTHLVISEFRTMGPGGANDEFVEIYNPTSNWVDISGWIISGSNNDGSSVQTRATIPASTILRSGQYYLVANNGYTGTVTANLKYGTSIADDGGIALIGLSDQTSDEVGMSLGLTPGSAYQEGKTLSKLTDASRTYERRDGGNSDSCKDTNDNFTDFINQSSPSPHNYSTIRLCGGSSVSLISSTTQITSDSPDPSLVNANVSVSVKVTGSSLSPNGTKVNITGANTNCQITLNSSGTGSCNVKFTSTGLKTLTATYLGDNTHISSSDTESHQVTSSSTTFKTPTPAPLPPPQLVAINEFVPRPGHDWNHDGTVNVGDEYIEILNHGTVDVNLSGYSLDDEVNIGSNPYRLPSKVLKPGERVVFYGSETGLLLGDGGDGVRLLKPNGQLMDAYNYTIARYPDESYCRLPDNGGADDWNQYCYPTPGLQNSLSGNFAPPSNGISEESSCPISDTLPDPFVQAECDPFGNNIWRSEFWDRTGWYDGKDLPKIDGKWPVFAD